MIGARLVILLILFSDEADGANADPIKLTLGDYLCQSVAYVSPKYSYVWKRVKRSEDGTLEVGIIRKGL